MWKFLIILLSILWSTRIHAEIYSKNEIKNPSGVHFEGISFVRRITRYWTIATSFDVQELYRHTEPLTIIARKYYDKACPNVTQPCRVKQSKLESWALLDDDIKTQWTRVNDYIRPFGVSRDAGFEAYSSAYSKDERRIITILSASTEEEQILNDRDRLTYIVAGPTDTIKALDLKQQEINEIMKNPTINNESNLINIINALIKGRLNLLKSIIDIITYTKLGLVHPLLFRTGRLRELTLSFSKDNDDETETKPEDHVSLPLDGTGLPQLQSFTNVKLLIEAGRVIITLQIPLIENKSSELYYVHAYPVIQRIGKNATVHTLIRPTSNYLLVNHDWTRYSYLTINDINQSCKELDSQLICNPLPALQNLGVIKSCEIALINNNTQEPYRNCDITIHTPLINTWITFKKPGEWLYSLVSPEVVQIACPDRPKMNLTLEGYGKFKIGKGCNLTSQSVELHHVRKSLELHSPKDFPSYGYLNLHRIFPEIDAYESFLLRSDAFYLPGPVPLTVMAHILHQTPSYNLITPLRSLTIPWYWSFIGLSSFAMLIYLCVSKCVQQLAELHEKHVKPTMEKEIETPPPKPANVDVHHNQSELNNFFIKMEGDYDVPRRSYTLPRCPKRNGFENIVF